MQQSPVVLEWQAQAAEQATLKTKATDILKALEFRLHRKPPLAVAEKVKATTDLELLERWFKAAVTVDSMKEFRELLKQA